MLTKKKAVLERFARRQAILRIENGQELTLSKDELGQAQLGESFVIHILPSAEAELTQAELARTLLNQILEG